MTRPPSLRARAATVGALLATTAAFIPLLAAAQHGIAPAEAIAPVESTASKAQDAPFETTRAPALREERLQVGDATRRLLDMQREGSAASVTPRPLAGEVASLSYKRYLDSFKFPIPEKFSATVQKSGSGSR